MNGSEEQSCNEHFTIKERLCTYMKKSFSWQKVSLYMTLQSWEKEEFKGRHKLGDKSHQHVTATLCESPYKFKLIWSHATCHSKRILLQKQRILQKFSSTHSTIWPFIVLLQLVAQPVHKEWFVTAMC